MCLAVQPVSRGNAANPAANFMLLVCIAIDTLTSSAAAGSCASTGRGDGPGSVPAEFGRLRRLSSA